MRYLYKTKVVSRYIGTGVTAFVNLDPIKVSRPASFSNGRLLNEGLKAYKKRLQHIKVYVKAMKNGINKASKKALDTVYEV
jgi:hypothetical protein